MFWSKNTGKNFLRSSLLFSKNFSISPFNIPKDMIINTIYIQNTVRHTVSKIRLEYFLKSFIFDSLNTSIVCSWSIFDSDFSIILTDTACDRFVASARPFNSTSFIPYPRWPLLAHLLYLCLTVPLSGSASLLTILYFVWKVLPLPFCLKCLSTKGKSSASLGGVWMGSTVSGRESKVV